MAMTVHQRGLVRRDLDLEDAHVSILKCRVMVRFGRDLDLGSGLRHKHTGKKQESAKQSSASHGARF